MFAYWWAVFVYGIVFGIVTNKVIKNKGYEENWFWWGYLFGVFALIVACTKPSKVAVTGMVQTPVVDSSVPQAIGSEQDYDTLCSLPENQYSSGSPILICEGKLLKEKVTEKIFAKCKFQVITTKKVKAAFVSVLEYDVAGDYLSKTDCQYLDLDRMDGICFGEKKLVSLANMITRKIEVVCTKVIFEDGTRWEATEDWKALPQQPTIHSLLGSDMAEQYKQDVNANATYVPNSTEHYWNCACGCMNHANNTYCLKCGTEKFKVFSAYDKDNLLKKVNEKKQREEATAQKAAQEAQAIAQAALERKRKNKKMLMKYGPIVVGIFVVILLLVNVVIPGVKYSQADKLVKVGQYDEAINAYKAIGDSRKTEKRIDAANYARAEALVASGEYSKALTFFKNLGNYQDAQEKVNSTIYAYGVDLISKGKFEDAIKQFKQLGDYEDAAEKIKEARYAHAEALVSQEKFISAIAKFNELGDYKDSAVKAKVARYAYAKFFLSKKEYNSALEQFEHLGDYEDASEQAKNIKETIKKIQGEVFVEWLEFDTSRGSSTTRSYIPKSADYLHYKFKLNGSVANKSYTLRHRVQWPAETAKLSDWNWEDVKVGDTKSCVWENGYTAVDTIKSKSTLVIEILIDGTDIVIGKFVMPVR